MNRDKTAIPRRRAMGRLAALIGAGIGATLSTRSRPAHARDARPKPERPARTRDDGPIWIGHI